MRRAVSEALLRRLFQRVLVLSVPLPIMGAGAACGSATGIEGNGEGTAGFDGSQSGSGGSDPSGSGGSAGAGGNGASIGAGGTGVTTSCGGVNGLCTTCKTWKFDTWALDAGTISAADCRAVCGNTQVPCTLVGQEGDLAVVRCQYLCVTGRRPPGFLETPTAEQKGLGPYFAELALLEAASVRAFRLLADELRRHGAPMPLIRAARRASDDEVHHARTTAMLARRCGVTPKKLRLCAPSKRSLFALAVDNAKEGCVRETFGALLATYQAKTAKSPIVRASFSRIARDETRHAALAWRIGEWLDRKLEPKAREQVRSAREAAGQELVRATRHQRREEWFDLAGLPSAQVAVDMALEMQVHLWRLAAG